MPVCAVKLCKNNTTDNKKTAGITYHQFPNDPVIYDLWAKIIRLSRQESWWKPGKRSVICSAHFNESDLYLTKGGLYRLCKDAVPQKALFLVPDNISDSSTVTSEPSTSTPVANNDIRVVNAESSTTPVAHYDIRFVNGKPSTTQVPNYDIRVVNAEPSTTQVPNYDISVVTAESSTTQVPNYDIRVVNAEPSTTQVPNYDIRVVNVEPSTSQVPNYDIRVVNAEPSTTQVPNYDISVINAESSTSAPVVNYDISFVPVEANMLVSLDEGNIITTENVTPSLNECLYLDYTIETPRIIVLQQPVHKKSILHGRIIKNHIDLKKQIPF